MTMLSREAIEALAFDFVDENVQISERASFYGASRIALGNNIRIDDFCILSAGAGGISLGDHVHIAVYSSLVGAGRITLSGFCNILSHVAIYSSNDDYSGVNLTNPTFPRGYTGVTHADVFLGKHVIVGNGGVILPGVTLEEGVAIGALSLVQKRCEAFGIYVGNSARRIKERKRDLLELEQQFIASKVQ